MNKQTKKYNNKVSRLTLLHTKGNSVHACICVCGTHMHFVCVSTSTCSCAHMRERTYGCGQKCVDVYRHTCVTQVLYTLYYTGFKNHTVIQHYIQKVKHTSS